MHTIRLSFGELLALLVAAHQERRELRRRTPSVLADPNDPSNYGLLVLESTIVVRELSG